MPGTACQSVSKPPPYLKSSTGPAQPDEILAFPKSPAQITAAQARKVHAPPSALLYHHQCTCFPQSASVPAHRANLSFHTFSSRAILGKLTSLGLGFFFFMTENQSLPPRFPVRTKSRLTGLVPCLRPSTNQSSCLPPRPRAGRARRGASVPAESPPLGTPPRCHQAAGGSWGEGNARLSGGQRKETRGGGRGDEGASGWGGG